MDKNINDHPKEYTIEQIEDAKKWMLAEMNAVQMEVAFYKHCLDDSVTDEEFEEKEKYKRLTDRLMILRETYDGICEFLKEQKDQEAKDIIAFINSKR